MSLSYQRDETKTLSKVITDLKAKGKKMQEQEVLRIMASIILALNETHNKKFIHRNLSSTHVLYSEDHGNVKLISHANVPFKKHWENKKYDGQIWCEHYYLCEDVASGTREYEDADDIYEVGIVLHEILTMSTPDKPAYTATFY